MLRPDRITATETFVCESNRCENTVYEGCVYFEVNSKKVCSVCKEDHERGVNV